MSHDELAPGARLGRHRIVRALGRGGMGVVYEAADETTGERVAIKLLWPALARDERFRARFMREARASRAVQHENVVRLVDVGDEQGRPFLVLELVPGGSLAQRIRTGPMPWRQAAVLGAEIARALAAVHAAGLVHRDLKPGNVLLDASGRAKLSDFGLVRRSPEQLSQTVALTRDGDLVGTPEYMAPEQAEGGEAVDARSDLYALGATLYDLLAGRPPFLGQGLALVKAHIVEAPKPPSALVRGLPRDLDALVLELLAKDPRERPPSALEVARRLDRIALGSEGRNRAKALLVAAAVLAALVAGAAIALRGDRTPKPAPPAPAPPLPVRPPAPPPPPRLAPPSPGSSTGKRPFLQQVWWASSPTKVLGSAFSPDGKYFVTGRETRDLTDREIAIWEASEESGMSARSPIATLHGHEIITWRVAFARNGKYFVTGGFDGGVSVWDFEKARRGDPASRTDRQQPGGEINAIAVSPSGERVVSGDGTGELRVWALDADGKLDLKGIVPGVHAGGIGCAAFVDEQRVATGGTDACLVVTDLDEALHATLARPAHGWIVSVAVSPDRRQLLAGTWDGHAEFVEIASGKLIKSIAAHARDAPIRGLAWTPDGLHAVTASHDATVRVWDTRTWDKLSEAPLPERAGTLAIAPDGRHVVVGLEGAGPFEVKFMDLFGKP